MVLIPAAAPAAPAGSGSSTESDSGSGGDGSGGSGSGTRERKDHAPHGSDALGVKDNRNLFGCLDRNGSDHGRGGEDAHGAEHCCVVCLVCLVCVVTSDGEAAGEVAGVLDLT